MMSRRRIVALVSAVLMLAIAASVIGAFVLATQSEGGRETIRRLAEAQLARLVRGNVHIGTLSGSFLTDLRVDSLRIADVDDSVFVATGPVRVTFDPRDLADGRIILRTVEIERPFVVARREIDGPWTHQKLFPRSRVGQTLRRRSAFGAVFILEQAQVRNGEFALLLPWAPDSAPADVRTRAWRWQNIALDVPRARLAYPDSAGQMYSVARLDVDESDPPFAFRDMVGEVRQVSDTIWFDFAHFKLPGSGGRGTGRIDWGPDRPVNYAVQIEADTVSLADIAWIDPAIPTEGGGRMHLAIRNAAGDPGTLDYVITQMDVRSHRSHLLGAMTWGVGGPEVALRDVDLEMAPLDAALIERFNQGPLAVPLRGQFTGRVRALGGPLDRFVVDDAEATFRDGNVSGAVSRARAAGMLDLRDPGTPVFLGLSLDVASLDLRTAQALDPDFPRLNGEVRGTARLDSLWGDVRFSQADLTHRDGDSPESRLRGDGRLAWEDGPVRWEVEGAALPLSFTALARSFTAFPLRGEFNGPISSAGSIGDLVLVGDLLGEAGRIETDLRIDAEAPGSRLVGRATLTAVDPRRLFDSPRAPTGELTARLSMNARFDSLADLTGDAQVAVDRSVLDGARIFAGTAGLTFGDGRAMLDTLYLESSAMVVSGRGALGLRADVSDSVVLRARMDSLGGLRPWLGRPAGDSLAGAAILDARATGWVREFAMNATATAEGLLYAGNTADALRARTQVTGLPSSVRGTLRADGDSLRLGGLVLRAAEVTAARGASGETEIEFVARGPQDTQLRSGGLLATAGDTTRIRIDSLSLSTDLHRWTLGRPATLAFAEGGFQVDSLGLRTGASGFLALVGGLPAEGALDLRLTGREIPVADLAELLQLEGTQEGVFDLNARLGGTRAAPTLEADGVLRQGLLRGIRLDTLRAVASAAADQLDLRVVLGPRAQPLLRAEGTMPLVLGLDGRGVGMNDAGALRATVRADSLDLGLFESLTGGTTGARGMMAVSLDVGGTWGRPVLDGSLAVRNGSLAPAALGDVRWRNVQADIGFFGDSIAVRNVTAVSGPARTGRATINGWVSLTDRDNPQLDVRWNSRGFNVFARPNVADIDVSGDLRLAGAWRGATLRGALTADRATISIPELASKDVISLEGPDRFGTADTLVMADTRSVAVAPPAFIDNLTIAGVPVRMGREVWIRSSEANINLGGEVSITRGRVTRGVNAGQQQLALDGPLQTVRGTYRLNLGPVQRTFEVEQGEIRFYGDPELNPTLDISALHTVRQYSEQGVRPDVRVRVHLGGTLQNPTAELSTPDSLRVTNADLISYLVTGGPSFEIGGRNGDISATAARVLLGSFGSVLGGKAAGGLCDDAQVSTAGLDAYGGRFRNVGGGILAGTRFNCAKQVGDRAFVRLDAGLCQVGQLMTQGSGGDPLSFTDALGLKLDYLLGRGFSASVGVEPPTSAVLCAVNANASARGFVPTPRQVGFDLFRVWRF